VSIPVNLVSTKTKAAGVQPLSDAVYSSWWRRKQGWIRRTFV